MAASRAFGLVQVPDRLLCELKGTGCNTEPGKGYETVSAVGCRCVHWHSVWSREACVKGHGSLEFGSFFYSEHEELREPRATPGTPESSVHRRQSLTLERCSPEKRRQSSFEWKEGQESLI